MYVYTTMYVYITHMLVCSYSMYFPKSELS